MAQRLKQTVPRVVQYAIILLFGGSLCLLLLSKHYEISVRDATAMLADLQTAAVITAAQTSLIDPCPDEQQLIILSATMYVCDSELPETINNRIYQTYPVEPSDAEPMYGFMERGDQDKADEMLEDVYHLDRYEAVTLPEPMNWEADPFEERYWRFVFYSLRPLRHLLAAGDATGNEAYYEKAASLVSSFAQDGVDSPYAWDDPHGAAFRTMMLIEVWWTFREEGILTAKLSEEILALLRLQGEYLLQPDNYEGENNHGVTQAAALLQLAHNFPDLPNADVWQNVATERLDSGLSEIIDEDGVLIENSPYYHFYVLEKYWEIYKYLDAENIVISDTFNDTIKAMVEFGTYVMRPDQSIPLLGASIPRTFTYSTFYQDIAASDQAFKYSLTQGREGRVPEVLDAWYPSSGIALWRSAWGSASNFADQTHVLIDTGPYRTDHSDLDALTFSLYGLGTPIIRDVGLFTYETNNPLYNYYYGTRGHNTIIVDNQNQAQGSGEVTALETNSTYATLAAKHSLYPGVTHYRTMVLLKPRTLLIIDEVIGDTTHTYEQLFHFKPQARFDDISNQLLDGFVTDKNGERVNFQIEQLLPVEELTIWEGQTTPPRGWCSVAYEEQEACPEVSFEHNATSTRYVTAITISSDEMNSRATYNEEQETVRLTTDDGREFIVDVSFPEQMREEEFVMVEIQGELIKEEASGLPAFIQNIQNFLF